MKNTKFLILMVAGLMAVQCTPKMSPAASPDSGKMEKSMAPMTGLDVVKAYLDAIGGQEKLNQVKDIQITLEGNTAMGSLTMKTMKKDNTKMAMTIESNGMTFMDQRYNGSKATVSSPQGSQEITDENALDNFRRQSYLFPELNYLKDGYKAELGEMESYKGKDVQVVKITTPDGTEIKEFYDPENHLKVKTELEAEVQGMKRTVINETADYREVSGIKIPYSLTISGAMPMALKLDVTDVKVNSGLPDTMFESN
ncbi:MAG: hypothetical protein R2806_07415 [Saprospiraceae bacterium]